MNSPALVWRAFRAMLRMAARDPTWAIGALVLSPIRAGNYLLCAAAFLVIVLVVLVLGLDLGASIAFPHNIPVHAGASLLACLITALLGYRLLTNPLIQHFGNMAVDTHGSARFATSSETSRLIASTDGLLLGRDLKTGKPIRYDSAAHLLTMAPTRTGKGVGTIIPNLLTANRSVICIDPKGENARIAGRTRNRFGQVHVLDPFGVTGLPSSAFNPLLRLQSPGQPRSRQPGPSRGCRHPGGGPGL